VVVCEAVDGPSGVEQPNVSQAICLKSGPRILAPEVDGHQRRQSVAKHKSQNLKVPESY